MKERLNKYIARCGICSRRAADELIENGLVRVNKKLIREMGVTIDPLKDEVIVKNHVVRPQEEKLYIILHKPVGAVTTVKDPEKRKTVMDLISGIDIRLYPVGRLDIDTEGLLLLTNDGELANRLSHPRYGVKKTYLAHIKGNITETSLKKLEKGVLLEDGLTSPASVELNSRAPNASVVIIGISEGKNRQVRRMFEAVGHEVLRLVRIEFGNLKLGKIKKGEYRELVPSEIRELKKLVLLDKKKK